MDAEDSKADSELRKSIVVWIYFIFGIWYLVLSSNDRNRKLELYQSKKINIFLFGVSTVSFVI